MWRRIKMKGTVVKRVIFKKTIIHIQFMNGTVVKMVNDIVHTYSDANVISKLNLKRLWIEEVKKCEEEWRAQWSKGYSSKSIFKFCCHLLHQPEKSKITKLHNWFSTQSILVCCILLLLLFPLCRSEFCQWSRRHRN